MQPEVLVGDCRERLKELPDGSVHCCITSPPYWGLRDYGTGTWEGGDPDCDHVERNARNDVSAEELARRAAAYGTGTGNGSKVSSIGYRDVCGKCGARRIDKQIGLEETPDGHVVALVGVFREVKRVLRDDGQLWLNYGDCYASTPNGRSAADTKAAGRDDRTFRDKPFSTVTAGLKAKDLIGLPWMVAFALRADGWYLRSAITLCKNNPMPESVTDRPTSATEMLFLLTKQPRYYFDQEAVREPCTPESVRTARYALHRQPKMDASRNDQDSIHRHVNPAGRNMRNWLVLNSQPLAEAHFATFPEKLVEPCILAGTSQYGACQECGAPWKRVVEKGDLVPAGPSPNRTAPLPRNGSDPGDQGSNRARDGHRARMAYERKQKGWEKTCQCETDETVPCTVMDIFGGSGTVGKVATKLGRRSILIELNESYVDIIRKRNAQLGLGV